LSRLEGFCREVLVTTAAACRACENDAAIRCRMSCQIAIKILAPGERRQAGRWN
jgi:hypothetical protein